MKVALTLPQRPTALYMIAVLDSLVLLLVIFMLVAGISKESGILVDLPQSSHRLPHYDQRVLVTVTGGVNPAIFIGRERVNKEEFSKRLEKASEQLGAEIVFLQADESLAHRELMEIVGTIADLGLQTAVIGESRTDAQRTLEENQNEEPQESGE